MIEDDQTVVEADLAIRQFKIVCGATWQLRLYEILQVVAPITKAAAERKRQVHLIQQPSTFDGIDPTAPHLALEVEDLDAVKRVLDERGVPYLALGEAQLWIRDPDGNVVELCTAR